MAEQIGYIRVSSVGQSTDRQLDGIELDVTFEEKVSAKDTKRPKLQECLQYVRKGDTLHIHSIDRLARNLVDLEKTVEQCTDKGVAVKFHKENLTFTGKNDKMQTLLFQMLGAVAQFERALIRERQQEGIEAAKKAGKHLGRPAKINDMQRAEICAKYLKGMNPSQLAREYNISRASVYNVLAENFWAEVIKEYGGNFAPGRMKNVIRHLMDTTASKTIKNYRDGNAADRKKIVAKALNKLAERGLINWSGDFKEEVIWL